MSHVVIIGAGLGGMAGAYEMREALSANHQVTVINEREDFQFVPSNPWIAVGWRTRPQTSFKARPYLEKKGIRFIAKAVTEIKPTEQRLVLNDGETVNYDYLIIATGPQLDFPAVEGAGPHSGFTQSICTLDHAEICYNDFSVLCANPGPMVVGALPGASCYGPAYEYAFIADTEMRRRRIRDRVPMTYITPEPYIGHLGLGGVGDSKSLLESEFRKRHIQWITNARVTKIEQGKVIAEELNEDGSFKKRHELPFKHSMMLPAFRGVSAVANVEGLCNPKGFVTIDEFQRNPKYLNIFAAGVCVAIPPVEMTPVPVGMPKTGYMIESMFSAIVANIKAITEGGQARQQATWNAICLADMGDTGAAFVAAPQIPPRNVTWTKQGKWVHYAKAAFELYFLGKMKMGTSEPFFEKYLLKAVGIERLK